MPKKRTPVHTHRPEATPPSRDEGKAHHYKKIAADAMAEALAAKVRLEHLLASSSGVIFSCLPSKDYAMIFISGSVKSLLGYEPQEFLDTPKFWFECIHPDDREEVSAMLRSLSDVKHLVHDIRVKHKEGTYRWMRNELKIVSFTDGKPEEIVGYWIDITGYKSLEQQILVDAFHDTLSNLPNRALFMDRLGVSFARIGGRMKNYKFAVLCIDLDRFKNVNDSLGHRKGDQLLVAVAKRLMRCVRFGDTVARLGGDEFAMILDDIKNSSDAEVTAERIQKEICRPFDLDGNEVFTTASIGIAIAHPGTAKAEHLLRDADTAMYRAKASGLGCNAVFDESMRNRAVSLLQLETDLRRAVERNEFVLHYQPIISLKEEDVVGFEALIRWRHPSQGLIQPNQFIPLAEETGLIMPIGQWVLHEACRQMRDWQKRFPQRPPLTMSVNISNKQILPGFPLEVKATLQKTGLNPSSLRLEITESTVIENSEWAGDMLAGLRRMKVCVIIDDFGTGYSSMQFINKFPVDGLKIDRSFIMAMKSSGEGWEIVRTILNLARNLGLDVVAEGVETPDQLQFLRRLNGEYAQGFYFHEPMEAATIENILASNRAK